MTEQEAFEHNVAIAEKHGLFAGQVTYGPHDDWLGMVYFRDTEMECKQDQIHFAYALDFINDEERSKAVLEKLLNGKFI